jgi:hypothetical protein
MFCVSESGGEDWKVGAERFERYGLKKSLGSFASLRMTAETKNSNGNGQCKGLRGELRAKTKSYG